MIITSSDISKTFVEKFSKNNFLPPRLVLEPGRSMIGRTGITLNRVRQTKTLPDGTRDIAIDGDRLPQSLMR